MASEVEDSLYEEVGDFLLHSQSWHDCHFLVGENKERIGAVRSALVNQSIVWFSMLSPDSALVEKGDIALPDIEPTVFRLLLKHSYGGLEDCSALPDETAVNLCYCANKYLMKSLMKKIAPRLKPSSVAQCFPALHCLVYYNLKDVEEAVKQIVQTRTKEVFAHPEFLECDAESVAYIAQQEALSCEELELWKAVVAWAKHKAESDDGPKLRERMSSPLQHIRLLSLDSSTIYTEVLTQGILNSTEIASLCRGDIRNIQSLCSIVATRREPNQLHELTYSDVTVVVRHNVTLSSEHFTTEDKSCTCIAVKHKTILLKSITCRGLYNGLHIWPGCKALLFYRNLSVSIALTITHITDGINNSSEKEPVVITHDDFKFSIGDVFTVPTLVDGKGVVLKANSKYKIDLIFSGRGSEYFPCWSEPDCVEGHNFEHGTFHCSLVYDGNGIGTTPCHIQQFTYGVVKE